MYFIQRNSDHLLVEFMDNFDYNVIRSIFHHVTMLKEYPDTNDIWLIAKHRASIRLHEVEAMVQDFSLSSSNDMTRKKTAIVADQGLTFAILSLWATAVQKRVPFKIKMFTTLEDAQAWMGINNPTAV